MRKCEVKDNVCKLSIWRVRWNVIKEYVSGWSDQGGKERERVILVKIKWCTEVKGEYWYLEEN